MGKFAPLHLGHQRMIEAGLCEMDEMLVLIYDSPQVTDVPLPVRSGWLRKLYPEAIVIEGWGGPTDVGLSQDLMRAHEGYVIDTLGIEGITHFYSSEPYGEHMSKALGAVDRRFDQDREVVPISGTDIRLDPFAHRSFLSPIVYRDLVMNVVFLGAPGTGKTTLAKELARRHDTGWMPEYGREYWEAHHIERRLSQKQLMEIAEVHLAREDEALESANSILFTDTNMLTTATFARYYHGRVAPGLEQLVARSVSRYDLVFVCDTDIPYDNTWDRSGPANRLEFQRQVIADLRARKIPYFVLGGTLEERIAKVDRVLIGYRKYGDYMDAVRSWNGC